MALHGRSLYLQVWSCEEPPAGQTCCLGCRHQPQTQASGARLGAHAAPPPGRHLRPPRRGRSRPGPSPAGGTSAASGPGDTATAPAWAVAWAACGGTPLASAGTPRLPLGSCGGCSGPRPNRRRNAAAAAGPAAGFAPRITFRGCQLRLIQECVWPSGHDIHRNNLWRASCSA